jgi:uncharacterized membrane protein
MNTKTHKILYWITTGIVAFGMGMAAMMYLSRNPELMASFSSIGIPDYLVMLLGIFKLLGAIALVIPSKSFLKDWAYAGLAFMFIGATWVHIATATPFVAPLVMLVVLLTSYRLLKTKPAPEAVAVKTATA